MSNLLTCLGYQVEQVGFNKHPWIYPWKTVHCSMYTVTCALLYMQCALCMHFVLLCVHCTLKTIYCQLCTFHIVLSLSKITVHYIKWNVHHDLWTCPYGPFGPKSNLTYPACLYPIFSRKDKRNIKLTTISYSLNCFRKIPHTGDTNSLNRCG